MYIVDQPRREINIVVLAQNLRKCKQNHFYFIFLNNIFFTEYVLSEKDFLIDEVGDGCDCQAVTMVTNQAIFEL